MKPIEQELFGLTGSLTPPITGKPESPEGELILCLEIPGRLPSWNDLLGLEHWARYKFKKMLQETFLCELRRCASDSSTKTTSARNTMLIAADTLALFLETARQQRALKSAKKKQEKVGESMSASKSSKDKAVPF